MRKQSQDDETLQGVNTIANIQSRVDKLGNRSLKMYEKIDQVICKAIQAIEQSQKAVMQSEDDWNSALLNLHIKMTQIKPLKTLKDQYNDFYKKLSGFGKAIEQTPVQNQHKIQPPELFNQNDLKSIQQSLSDHYLSQRNYEAALSIMSQNEKKKLFQECYQINEDILLGKFDKAAEWVRNANLNGDDGKVAYEIQKMKVIKLVRDNKADQAIAYLRQNLGSYASQNGNQISKLMNYIITQSNKYWGAQSEYTGIYKDRYNVFITVQLQELAAKFTSIYLKTNKIYLINPIAKCHQVGNKFKLQFLEHLKYMPVGKELPKILPFSIKSGLQNKYHSQFYCPVTKQMHGPLDKNVVLSCGHMVSHSAVSRLMESRDTRRKMKCPICQSDQAFEQHLKVEF